MKQGSDLAIIPVVVGAFLCVAVVSGAFFLIGPVVGFVAIFVVLLLVAYVIWRWVANSETD